MYHKIINEENEIIGISGPDSDDITDENWIEISKDEYDNLEEQMREYEEIIGGEENEGNN